jgi:hypothetical protein
MMKVSPCRAFAVLTAVVSLSCFTAAANGQDNPEIQVEETRFAPGTVNVVPPAPLPEETFSGPLALKKFLADHPEIEWQPPDFPEGRPFFDASTRTLFKQAQQVILRREVFCFEFAFKPLRQMYVDLPQPGGRLKRSLVWYMVYRVRYTGGDLRASKPADSGGSASAVDALYSNIQKVSYDARRFFPRMVMVDHETGREYADRILPAAKTAIRRREKISAPLYNNVEITGQSIKRSSDPAAEGVWGVVTWVDVNRDVDFLSLYVYGLTNAFRLEGDAGAEPELTKKALMLNFYRPGDEVRQTEDRIRFGVPAFRDEAEQNYVLEMYGLEKRLDYDWVYR